MELFEGNFWSYQLQAFAEKTADDRKGNQGLAWLIGPEVAGSRTSCQLPSGPVGYNGIKGASFLKLSRRFFK